MSVPDITLNNGVRVPQLGLGVWQVPDDGAERAVATALRAGYRSIDTARLYFNEEGVGRAIRESGVPRGELFVTTKLWNDAHAYDAALRAFDASLDRLGLDYVDLFLIHWPVPAQDLFTEAWRAFEKLYASGRVKAIGVSNFGQKQLERLADESDIVPAVNQIELHPYLAQSHLRQLHAERGIATQAWSPLGSGRGLLEDPVLVRIGAAYGRSAAQVVLRWHLQRGNVVIPKSVTPSRIEENLDVFDFELTAADMAAIDGLNKDLRYGPDPQTFNKTS
ncbi:MAG: aldo/keto reductase [Streptosporangiaceae bacterium]